MTISSGIITSGILDLASGIVSSPEVAILEAVLISSGVYSSFDYSDAYVSPPIAVCLDAYEIFGSGVVYASGFASTDYPTTFIGGYELYTGSVPGVSGDTGQLIVMGAMCNIDYDILGNAIIQFYDNSLGTISTRLWDFGDGNFSSEKDPVHTYTSNGVYYVTLTITYTSGVEAIAPVTIIINSIISPQVSIMRTVSNICPVIANQRISPYKLEVGDKLQVKAIILRNNKPLSGNNIPVELWLNPSGAWAKFGDYTTDRNGTALIKYSCNSFHNIDCCLGYIKATYDGKTYNSNSLRFNFIQ